MVLDSYECYKRLYFLKSSIITKHKKTFPDIKKNGTFNFLTSENITVFDCVHVSK